jgi:uncharacterized protein YndB with AHSA1/START domain
MTNNLQFEFTLDKEAKTVYITREFDAGLSLVWDAFTKAELLDQWVAPKPWSSRTKHMDFKVGGRRFYAMVSPEGMERWSIQRYTSISPKTNFTIYNESLARMEKMIEMGFKEGYSMSMINLENLLATLSKPS